MSRRQDLTKSQSRWLSHLRRCEAQGGTMSAYASSQGLSLGAMYEAARTLRRKGAWPGAGSPGRGSRPAASERGPEFVRVRTPLPCKDASWRARLPNGVVLEGQESVGPELVALLASL